MSSEKKEYIEGVYNYCDRWCEKCKFTANCLLFTQESKINTYEILHNGDISGIEEVFNKEIDRMENEFGEEAEDSDDYLDDDFFESIDEEGEEFNLEDEEEKVEKHPISALVDEYFTKAHALVKLIDAKYNFSNNSKESLKNPIALKAFDDFETFLWYHTFIGAKIKRALFGLNDIDNEEEEELREIDAYDMNGSAKIGIISIKRSIEALNNLHKILPVFSIEIEEGLILLGKMLNLAEEIFPDCMSFKRPGFDI